MPKRWFANTLPAPATWLMMPSKTRRPVVSRFMPSSRKCRKKRPLCDTPKPIACRISAPSPSTESLVRSWTQKRHEVAHRGKADAEHLRLGRLVPHFVDLERLESAALGQQADRAVVDKFPFRARDIAPSVAFAIPHREPRLRLVERRGRVGEAMGEQLDRSAR